MSSWQSAVDCVNAGLRAGVNEWVICGGARNAVLIEVLAQAEAVGRVRLWRHFEERSAGFFALGRIMDSGRPCAVVTTSGTAAAELMPAMIEAFYQARPLLAVTADRPASFRGSGAPQAILQDQIFGPYAFRPLNCLDAWEKNSPAHWNIELDESFEPAAIQYETHGEAPTHESRSSLDVSALARWLREDVTAGLVVMLGGIEVEEHEAVYHFCHDLAVPVAADASSGLREALGGLVLQDADRVLAARPPGKILRLGEVPSGRFWRDLEGLPRCSVWSVCRNGLPGLARESSLCHASPGRVIRALGQVDRLDDVGDLLLGNPARAARLEELLECYPDSEPAMMRALSHYAALSDGVFLGNSLPLREWNQFAQWARPVTHVRANRGANGIDGQISTWLGWSAEIQDSWAVIGDLTALYDLAAGFMLPQLADAKRVLAVINNGGGRIFDRLPRMASMSARASECLINPHAADLSGLATMWGMRHEQVRVIDDFDLLDTHDSGTLLLELRPDPVQTSRFWRDWNCI